MSETKVLVAGGNQWGGGPTLDAAKRQFRRFGGRLSDGYEIVTFDAHTRFDGVDEAGRFHYEGTAPTRKTVAPRRTR